jgi:hypothetical protein
MDWEKFFVLQAQDFDVTSVEINSAIFLHLASI